MPSSSSSHSSGKVYLTPQIEKVAKRRNGLCPSLLGDKHIEQVSAKNPTMCAAIKSYQTNTKYMNEDIRELKNHGEEFKFITDSVQNFLRDCIDEKRQSTDLVTLDFQPKGCTWSMELNPTIGAPDYMIQVQCLARPGEKGTTTFVVDTKLVGKSSKSIASTSLPGFREAKATFEMAALVVRKAVVKCEFPNFPEGCKGRTFREVYQLNARVSYSEDLKGTCTRWGRHSNVSSLLACSLSPVHLPLFVVEPTVQAERKLPSSVCFERICPQLMMPPFLTRLPSCRLFRIPTLFLSSISSKRKTATSWSWSL